MPARRNASNSGKGFEELLSRIFAAYEQRRIATFEKVEQPMKIMGSGKARRVVFLKNPFLDFTGVWTAQGGRAIHVEAKSSEAPRLPIGDDSSGLKDKQVTNLKRWDDSGAATGVLWLYAGDVRLIPIEHVRRQRRDAFFPWEEAIPIPQGPGFIIYDFLALLTPRISKGTLPGS